jgi:chemotaxis protein CheX
MMDTAVAIDCSPKVIDLLAGLLGEEVHLLNESFENIRNLQSYRIIILEHGNNQNDTLQRIRNLRYACYFRNIPIILIKSQENIGSMEAYLTSGATEVLSVDDPPAACQQILKGYLIPNREPLKEEMEYLHSFIKNTCAVLKTMASLEVVFREVYFTHDFRIFGDISGIIGLSGEAEGMLCITLYWPLAQTIIANMMNVDEDQINAELIHDGVAEIVNMISGSTKKDFVGKPYHFEISLPSVVVGSGHQIGHAENTPIAVLIFEVHCQYFALQVCLDSKKEKKKMV